MTRDRDLDVSRLGAAVSLLVFSLVACTGGRGAVAREERRSIATAAARAVIVVAPNAALAPTQTERVETARGPDDADALRRVWLQTPPTRWFPGENVEVPHEARAEWVRSLVLGLTCDGRVAARFDPAFFYLDLSHAPAEGGVHCRASTRPEACARAKLEAMDGLRGAAGCDEAREGSESVGGQSCREIDDVLECDDSLRFMTDETYMIRLDVRTRCPPSFEEVACMISRIVVWSLPVD